MLTNGAITVYHTDDDWETCSRQEYGNVAIFHKNKITTEQNGVYSSPSVVVRIPTDSDLPISPGDYLYIGVCSDDRPDKSICHKIMCVTDNRRGSPPMHHWRLDL